MFSIDAANTHTRITYCVICATVFSVLTQRLFVQSSELWSELLSWLILPVVLGHARDVKITAKPLIDAGRSYSTSSTSLWLVAAGLAVCSGYRAEFGIISFWPLLTPLLLAAETFLCSETLITKPSSTPWTYSLKKSLLGAALFAFFATYVLSIDNLAWSATSIVAVIAMLSSLVALLPRESHLVQYLPLINDIEQDMYALSRRVVLLLLVEIGVQSYAFGFNLPSFTLTTILISTKAGVWYFLIQLNRHVSWNIATTIGTFALMSSCQSALQSSDLLAFSHLIGSLISLWQVFHAIPNQSRARSLLWALFLIPLVPYTWNNLGMKAAESATYQSFSHGTNHPVQSLVENAVADFEILLQQQSKTYADAYREYKTRYSRDPPEGFEAWVKFALSHESPVIDEFDTMYRSISPFWSLSGPEVRQAMDELYNITQAEVWKCTLSTTTSGALCKHRHRSYDRNIASLFSKLVKDLRLPLPDITFLVNHLDEPRAMLPFRQSERAAVTRNDALKLSILTSQHTWAQLTKYCIAGEAGKVRQRGVAVDTYGMSFVTDMQSQKDLCQHPEYRNSHGIFMSPVTFRLVEGMVPLLSTGKLSTMSDVLFPSPAYDEKEFRYDGAHDIDWEAKRNNLYWAGSTSGGYAKDNDWRLFHRQRFVEIGQNLVTRTFRYLREDAGIVRQIRSTIFNIRRYDIAFTKVFQCEKRFCRDQWAFFNVRAWTNRDRAFRSRLVFDLDGNGISGRYYKLLASNSVPLKQTLLKEWHDDRLRPWVHYIPVSQSMEELPELVAYLTSNPKGQQIAREIAERGRDWFHKSLRDIDRSIYLYRLMLELADLQNPKRQRGQTPAPRSAR